MASHLQTKDEKLQAIGTYTEQLAEVVNEASKQGVNPCALMRVLASAIFEIGVVASRGDEVMGMDHALDHVKEMAELRIQAQGTQAMGGDYLH